MNNKQKLVYLSLIALTIIGILSGASYAYFSVENKIGNETVIESGTMALTFTDGSTITADKLIPGEYIEKTFSVRNTGTVRTNYDIYLSEVVNTFVNQSDLVYEIISSNGYNTSNQVQVPNTETKIINNYPIDPLQEHTYTLRITYKITNENQNDNMGRTFIAKINVNEYNSNNSERYIKLYDANNNEIDKQVLTNNSDYYYPLSNINLSNATNIYCDNGGIPTIENNQLKVSEVTSETNCRISNSINTTINNLPNTKTGIVMTNNQDNVTKMNIASNKEVVLDLNGKKIISEGVNTTDNTWNSSHGIFLVYGKLVINDSLRTGGMYTGIDGIIIRAGNGGVITINSGDFVGRLPVFINENNAKIIINNGKYISNNSEALYLGNLCSECKIEINDGYFEGTLAVNTKDDGLLTINGGKFKNNEYSYKKSIYSLSGNQGSIIINDGEFNSSSIVLENNSGIINISDGFFKSSDIVINNQNGHVNIAGGKIISTNNIAIYNRNLLNINGIYNPVYIYSDYVTNNGNVSGILNSGSTANLNITANKSNKCTDNYNDITTGLCIYGDNDSYGIKNSEANVTINGGTYISESIAIVNESSQVKIKNSFIEAGTLSIANGNWFVVKENKNPGTYNICSSTIKGLQYDLHDTNTGANISYSNDNIFSNGTNTPSSNKIYGSVNATGAACDW